jgi:hypothetical protein
MARKPMRKGTCRVIKTSAGKRKICRLKNGKIRFKAVGTKKRKKKATKRRRR